MEKKRSKIIMILYIINLLVFGVFSFILISNELLPVNYRMIYLAVMAAIQIFLGILVFRKSRSKTAKILMGLFTLAILAANGVTALYANQGVQTLDNIAKEEEDQVNMSLLTLNDSGLDNPEDIRWWNYRKTVSMLLLPIIFSTAVRK